MTGLRKLSLAIAMLFLPSTALLADTFGGWEFIEINHNFKNSKWFVTNYIEHDNISYSKFDCVYNRFTTGCYVLPWLRVGLAYDFMIEPGHLTHRGIAEVVGTLKSGNFKISLRERYFRIWKPDSRSNELRSRLKVQYAIPDSKFSPYLAIEVFTWGTEWQKARHYAACTYNFNSWMQLEWYYMYYAFKDDPAQHIIGIGLNFDL